MGMPNHRMIRILLAALLVAATVPSEAARREKLHLKLQTLEDKAHEGVSL